MSLNNNVVVLFVLLFISNNLLSQARLGSSKADIRSEFSDGGYAIENGVSDTGDGYIEVKLTDVTAIYWFDENNTCDVTFIIPDSQVILNGIVERYNNNYVVVSDTEWKMYSESGVSNITLVFLEKGGYLFRWDK